MELVVCTLVNGVPPTIDMSFAPIPFGQLSFTTQRHNIICTENDVTNDVNTTLIADSLELAYWSKCLREPQGTFNLPIYVNFDIHSNQYK